MIERKLLPCPFCGSEAVIHDSIDADAKISYHAYCTNENCIAHTDAICFDSKESAAEAWNKRSNGWISVEDKLPEEETPELLFTADGKVYYGSFGYSKFYAFDSSGIFAGFTTYEVSRWLPLPKPPMLEGDE